MELSLVFSLMDYCIKIWGTTNDKQMSNVQKLQNFAARVAFGGVKKYDNICPVFKELQWLRIKQKHLLDLGAAVFKVLRGYYPDWFLSFKSRPAITSGVTHTRETGSSPCWDPHCGTLFRPPSHRHLHSPLLRQNLRNFF